MQSQTNPSFEVSEKIKFGVFYIVALFLLIVGVYYIAITPNSNFFQELTQILTAPSILDMDGMAVGSFGSSFVNVAILLFLTLFSFNITKTKLGGAQIAAAMMVVGFAFYGKNVLNVWPIVLGVMLSAKIQKKPLSAVMHVAWFSTALSPISSVIAFGTPALKSGSPFAIILGIFLALAAGFLVGLCVAPVARFHDGFTLFNVGFAAGVVGILFNSALKAFGLGHDKVADAAFTAGRNKELAIILIIVFAFLFVVGVFLNKGFSGITKILTMREKAFDISKNFGFGIALINMGVLGIVGLVYVLLVGGQLNGPVYSGIWTMAGFAACSMSVFSTLPIMLGVGVMTFLTGGFSGAVANSETFFQSAKAFTSSRSMLVAALFSCGMSPVTATYGIFAGMLAGALHSLIVVNTGVLHGWMSLYNNGFSTVIVVAMLTPFLIYFDKKRSSKLLQS